MLEIAERTDAHRAQAIRERLRHPQNAKIDQGIALHHPKGVNGVDAAKSREAEMLLAEERRFTFVPIKDNETPAERFPERVEKTPPKFIDRIRHRVVKEFDTTLGKLDCDRRAFEYVIPRHVAMYLCKELTLHSYPTIGRKFGGKDHTSVMHAAKGCPARMLKDAFLCQTVVDLQAELEQEITHWRSGGELRNK